MYSRFSVFGMGFNKTNPNPTQIHIQPVPKESPGSGRPRLGLWVNPRFGDPAPKFVVERGLTKELNKPDAKKEQ